MQQREAFSRSPPLVKLLNINIQLAHHLLRDEIYSVAMKDKIVGSIFQHDEEGPTTSIDFLEKGTVNIQMIGCRPKAWVPGTCKLKTIQKRISKSVHTETHVSDVGHVRFRCRKPARPPVDLAVAAAAAAGAEVATEVPVLIEDAD